MLARAPQKVERVRAEIGGQTSALICDLAELAQVRRAAAECGELDALVNNAGVPYQPERAVTADGFELCFGVNYLAAYLLTRLLRTKLREGARIVSVAGAQHGEEPLPFQDLQSEKTYAPMEAAQRSKMALICFTHELARRWPDVRATCLHPGAARTGINADLGWPLNLLVRPMRLFFRSPASAAKPVVRLVTDPELADVTGQYFDRFEAKRAAPVTYDEDHARRLWEVSAELVGLEA